MAKAEDDVPVRASEHDGVYGPDGDWGSQPISSEQSGKRTWWSLAAGTPLTRHFHLSTFGLGGKHPVSDIFGYRPGYLGVFWRAREWEADSGVLTPAIARPPYRKNLTLF